MHVVCLVLASLVASSTRADDVVATIDEINHVLLESKIEAVEKALASVREVAADLVQKGDPRQKQVLARQEELGAELRVLREQRKTKADPVELRQLVKEFEASEDRGGWWWIDEKNPDKRGPWYRLERQKKRFVHYFRDANGDAAVAETVSATYEILGAADEDDNIILVRMTYPPKGAAPGNQSIMRFDRKTGVLKSSYGWYGQPKKSQ